MGDFLKMHIQAIYQLVAINFINGATIFVGLYLSLGSILQKQYKLYWNPFNWLQRKKLLVNFALSLTKEGFWGLERKSLVIVYIKEGL